MKDYEKYAEKVVRKVRKHAYSYVEMNGQPSDKRNDETWNARQLAIIHIQGQMQVISDAFSYTLKDQFVIRKYIDSKIEFFQKAIEHLKEK